MHFYSRHNFGCVGLSALIYQQLGFRGAKAPPHAVDWKGSHTTGSTVVFPLGFKDRLRILWSGKVEIEMLHRMAEQPRRWHTTADLAVLPPNEKLGAARAR